jgi:hypothetical protein
VLNKVLRVKHMRFSPTVGLLFRAYTPHNQACWLHCYAATCCKRYAATSVENSAPSFRQPFRMKAATQYNPIPPLM